MPAPLIDYLGLIMTPTTSPAIGDIPMRGASGGWTTIPVSSASPGSFMEIGTDGVPAWSSGSLGVVTALPTPSSTYRGKIITLSGQGLHRDVEYVCQENPDATLQWNRVPTHQVYAISSSTALHTVQHNLNNQYPLVQVVNASTGEPETPKLTFNGTDSFDLDFGTGVPTANYQVTVIG